MQPTHELIESRLARKLEATLGRWEAAVHNRFGRQLSFVVQLIRLFGRYIGACVASCVVSFGVYVFVMSLIMPYEMPKSVVIPVLSVPVGFFGVLLGALCLPSYHRRFGAFVLVLLGLSLFWFVELDQCLKYSDSPTLSPIFIDSLPLAGGGLLAALTVCFWRRRPNTYQARAVNRQGHVFTDR